MKWIRIHHMTPLLQNLQNLILLMTAVYNSDFGLNLNVGGRLNMHSVYNSNFVLM
jgi:hypothetical protein